jgi:hypothetical protein
MLTHQWSTRTSEGNEESIERLDGSRLRQRGGAVAAAAAREDAVSTDRETDGI